MKNRLIIKLLLVLLFIVITPKAYAADGQNSQSFRAHISSAGNWNTNSYSDCEQTTEPNGNNTIPGYENIPGCHSTAYHTYKFQMKPDNSNEIYPAFCIYPNASGVRNNGVTCRLWTVDEAPMTNYIASHHYDLIQGDQTVADLVFRMVGAREKYNGVNLDFGGDNARAPQVLGERRFAATWNARVITSTLFSGDEFYQYQGYVLHDIRYYQNQDGMRDEDGEVKQAVEILREAAPLEGSGSGTGGSNESVTDERNNKFELIPVAETVDTNTSTMDYIIKTKNGEFVLMVNVTALEGSVSWITPWNGTSGKIRITAVAHGEKCTAKVKIKGSNNSDGSLSNSNSADYDVISPSLETEHNFTLNNGIAVNTTYDGTINLDNTTRDGEEAKVYLCEFIGGGTATQSYIAIVKGNVSFDIIEVEIPCSCDSGGPGGGDGGGGNCPPAPRTTEFKEMEVNNCCEDGASSFGTQYALKELFCDYNQGGMTIKEYKEKCHTDDYKDVDDTININTNATASVYCAQYCSASFEYKLPGPTHSKQDTFFKFSKSNVGYSGPVLNQYKRCRTIIKYNEWYDSYVDNVEAEISNYNQAQHEYAEYLVWDKMYDERANHAESIEDKTVECSRSCTYTDNIVVANVPVTVTSSCSVGSDSGTVSGTTIHYYPHGSYNDSDEAKYNKIKRYHDDEAGKYTFSKLKLESIEKLNDTTSYYDKAEVEAYVSSYNGKIDSISNGLSGTCGNSQGRSCSNSCTDKIGDDYKTPRADPEEKMTNFKNKGDSYIDKLNGYVNKTIELKKALDICSGMITDDGKIDVPIIERVKFKEEPEMTFSYTTKFVQDDGSLADQVSYIPFVKVEPNDKCAEEYKTGFKDGAGYDENYPTGSEYFDDEYDTTKYLSEYTTINDLGTYDKDLNKDSVYTGDANSFVCANCNVSTVATPSDALPGNDYYDGRTYYASKKFTTDAMGHMTCKWKEDGASKRHVLVPSGVIIFEPETAGRLCEDTNYNCVVLNKDGDTYTNDGIYHTFKTHLEGKFETYFTLTNICDHLFDDILSTGRTCSDHDNTEIMVEGSEGEQTSNATCYIEIQANLQEYLSCSGEKVLSKDEAAMELCCQNPPCDDESPTMLFDYKVVDTTNMFPNKSDYGGGYAHNWLVDADGVQEYEEITNDAISDKTYAPENLTYSFTLTPKDLRAIREYNKSRIDDGGYLDFNLYCDGNGGDQPLTKCKSRFIEAISGGTMEDGTYSLSLKTNNMDLNEVRNNW